LNNIAKFMAPPMWMLNIY